MARKQVPASALAFKGRSRIVAIDVWDKDAIDLVEPGFTACNGEEGEMRFIAVRAWLDVRYSGHDGVPIAEFSCEGIDEGAQRSGRGWATPTVNGGLLGHIFFHNGDDSGFACGPDDFFNSLLERQDYHPRRPTTDPLIAGR
jgi:hypothetical protein